MTRYWLSIGLCALLGALGCSESSSSVDPGASGAGGGTDTPDGGEGGNQAPKATSFNLSVRADLPREVTLQGVDPNGDALQYTIVSQPYGGTLSGTGDTLVYTPEPGFLGTDSFSYSASDGLLSSEYDGYVWITVREASHNEPPQPASFTVFTSPNEAVTADLVTFDDDGDTLTYRVVEAPQHGTIALEGSVVTYTPATDWVGTDWLSYGVDDGSGEVTALVSLAVTPPPAFAPMTEADRTAAMAQLSAKMEELAPIDSVADLQALEAYARTVPGIAVVGSNPEGVWGQFTDGALFMIGIDAMPGVQPASGPLPPALAKPKAKAGTAAPNGLVNAAPWSPSPMTTKTTLPPGHRAVLLTGFGPSSYFGADSSPTLKGLLDKAQYQAEIVDGTITNYQHFATLGDAVSLVHLRTHGGDGYPYSRDFGGKVLEGIWSTTPASETLSNGMKDDIGAARIVFMNQLVNSSDREWHYGISVEFIKKYWTNVHRGAFVLGSSCWLGVRKGYDPSSGQKYTAPLSDLQKYFSDQGMLFGGWSRTVEVAHADKLALYVFDRMLGANTIAPVESPPQRPMGAATIMRDLMKKKLDLNAHSKGTAVFRFIGQMRGGDYNTNRLSPSIKTITADIDKNQLVVEGDFEVNGAYDLNNMRCSIDDTEYPVKTASPKQVVCDLPADASGDVRVVVEERKSPRVRLSSWKGALKYSIAGPGSLRQEWTFNVNLIGSVHKYRDEAGVAPVAHDGYVTMWAKGSGGEYKATGTYADGSTRVDWSGGGSLTPYTSSAASPPDGSFVFYAQAAADAPDKLWWNILVNMVNGGGATQKVYIMVDGSWELQTTVAIGSVFPINTAFGDTDSGVNSGPFALKIPAVIGPDGSLQAGQIPPEELLTCSACGLFDVPFYNELSWDTMAPVSGTEIDEEMPR